MANIKVGNTNITRMSVIEPYDDSTPSDKDEIKPWVRPSEWLDMPTYTSGEDKVGILAFMPSGTDLTVRIQLRGTLVSNYVMPTLSTVDWGDGNTTTVSGSHPTSSNPEYIQPAVHTYSYDDLSAESEFEYNGTTCRQSLIEITNSSGMYYLNLGDFNATYEKTDPDNYGRRSVSHNYLDLNIQSSGLTTLVLFEYPGYRGYARHCQKVRIRSDQSVSANQLFWNHAGLQELDIESGIFRDSTSFGYMFQGCAKLRKIPFFSTPNATTMHSMFGYCRLLEEIPDLDTANVTSFSSFAPFCTSLKKIPNLDYTNSNMYQAFYGCENVESMPTGINLSGVTNLDSTFNNCRKLKAISENLNLDSATITRSMFNGCSSLRSAPTINVPVATNISSMFAGCSSLRYAPEVNASTSTDAGGLFAGCTSLESAKINLPTATTTTSMFNDCHNLKKVDIININNSTSTYAMFADCWNLKTVNFNDTSFAPTTTQSMFQNCRTLRSVPYFDTSNCTTMREMFAYCYSIKSIPSYDFSSCDNLYYFAGRCSSLESVGEMRNMRSDITTVQSCFIDCVNLTKYPSGFLINGLAGNGVSMLWGVPVDYIPYMNISGATNFDYVNYSPFRGMPLKGIGELVFGVSDCENLFTACDRLTYIPDWDASGVTSFTDCFSQCQSLAWSDLQNVSCDIGYSYCYMSSGALTNVINNLVSGVIGKTLDIRYNYGAKELHPDTIAIATAKGWTVTI